MGFYLRKSISVGPLRFNLSGSGIGISTGIKGFRVGMGPRGNYVHMGRGGLYYRATLPPARSVRPAPAPQSPPSPTTVLRVETHAKLEEIESADVSMIVDSSSKDLLEEINAKRSKARLWPGVAVISAVAVVLGVGNGWPSWAVLTTAIVGFACVGLARTRDTLRKTVVLFYEFDKDIEASYGRLHEAASRLASCSAAWHISASGEVYDRKYHAGASSLVARKSTSIRRDEPPYLKTNIETIAITVGRQTLHFFPDRVLVYDTNGVGAVGYNDLRLEICTAPFIEEGSVPSDAEVIGKTWRYVNKSGGPDRRFKDNREIPICKYEEILLSSSTGLNEKIQLSHCGYGNGFADAISYLAEKLRSAREATSLPKTLASSR